MQSYTLYTTSEFLKDRHPYIPDPNPRPLMDPEQVAIAYNERAVPKLSDLLIYDKLSSEKRLAALHTLNELVSHQETKCDMITNKIVISATNLMKDSNADVRFEASFLVGSLLFLDVGRKQFDSEKVNYEIMQKLIFDEVTKVRESIGWLLYRLSLHKDGTMMMNESNTISQLVLAFNKYSIVNVIEENVIYLLYLLEAIINCSRYDYNIRQTLGRGLLNSFNRILEDYNSDYSSKLSRGLYRQMRELILSACKNITLTRSNMNNQVGYPRYLPKVKNLIMGTDGCGSNMFEECKIAFFKNRDAKGPYWPGDYLRAVTNANRLLEKYFTGERFGRIEAGYKADLDILDYQNPTPLVKENAAGHFIWGMSSNCVESVMVNGKLVMENRQFGFDQKEVYAKAAEVAKRLWERTDRLPADGTSGIKR